MAFPLSTFQHLREGAMDLKIIDNVLKFLERVEMRGTEAFAWCEAYGAIQQLKTAIVMFPPPPLPASAKDTANASV